MLTNFDYHLKMSIVFLSKMRAGMNSSKLSLPVFCYVIMSVRKNDLENQALICQNSLSLSLLIITDILKAFLVISALSKVSVQNLVNAPKEFMCISICLILPCSSYTTFLNSVWIPDFFISS